MSWRRAGESFASGSSAAAAIGTSELFGGLAAIDGSPTFDGIATIGTLVPSAGAYTLDRDYFFASPIVNVAVVINLNGSLMACTGTLTNNGNINDDGNPATLDVRGVVRAAGRFAAPARGALPGSNTAGASSNAPNPYFPVNTGTAVGGVATLGVAGTTTGAGGSGGGGDDGNPNAGGAIVVESAASGGMSLAEIIKGGYSGGIHSTITTGSGGGGGGNSGFHSGTGGAGGNAGGIAVVIAKTIAGTGTITARGGAGGAGQAAGGGGGGGGGGLVVPIYGTNSGPNTFLATGGAAGAAGGAFNGKAGGAGHAGLVQKYNLSGDGT